jgi:hypothetical protein
MKKNVATLCLALLAAGSSHAQPRTNADPKLLLRLQSMIKNADQTAKLFGDIANSADEKRGICIVAEAPVVGTELVAGGLLFGAPIGVAAAAKASIGAAGAIWFPSAGGLSATGLLALEGMTHKGAPQVAQEEMAPIVAQINSNHKDSQRVTLELINKNLDLLKAERDKVLATDMNGSFKNLIKDHMTCGSVSRRGTAKLAEIAMTEYNYLSAIYRAQTGGFPVHLSTYKYGTDSYKSILNDLEFLNRIDDVAPRSADIRQNGRVAASIRSQGGSVAPAKQSSDEGRADGGRAF